MNNKQDDIVQIRNPRSNRYVKINKTKGVMISSKKNIGPYKGIPIVKNKKEIKNVMG